MSITSGAFVARLPHLSPEEFKTHYENHIKMIEKIFGDSFPVVNRRYYTNADRKGIPQRGPESVPVYDAYTINEFRDEEHMNDFLRIYKDNFDLIDADEKKFIDQTKLSFAFADVMETRGTK